MSLSKLDHALQRISIGAFNAQDLVYALGVDDQPGLALIYAFADNVRKQYMGGGILLRGIVEFSNFCQRSCAYCGLQKNNHSLTRYRMSQEEILTAVDQIAAQGIKTVVLQSGEDAGLDALWLVDVIREIKNRHDLAVTLSVGEYEFDTYKAWKEAGADRYLLKIETTDPELYALLHPDMSFTRRLQCLKDLRVLGFQVGSGNLVGLPGQSPQALASDIDFFGREDFDMIGIGPFIPHQATRLKHEVRGDVAMVLKTLALTRIVTKTAHLPATTAFGSLGGDYRVEGLKAGANVLMPNFTPAPYRKLYEIYPGKRCVDEPAGACAFCMDGMARSIDRNVDYGRGDALKKVNTSICE
ncbi:MAG: [FeFe] hydrogenase H-cluster radical SAM maturase HydE [Candidatus Omnitrophica bacterium]|nr:[FeFe] hydrogenase H-cluster radical SAM maturase HydE [Candidatus Omnitrophota bacterium]